MINNNFFDQVILGQTGLKTGRIGISSSFGASAAVYEAAFERGFNYFTLGTFIRGSSKEMQKAIINIKKHKQIFMYKTLYHQDYKRK